MTKINKLGKSTFVIAILSFLLVAVLAFGGTYAYFSAQSTAVSGTVTTGHLRIEGIKEGEATEASSTLTMSGIVQPNQVIYNNTLKLDVDQNIAYYTRLKLTVSIQRAFNDNGEGTTDEVAHAGNGKMDNDETYKHDHKVQDDVQTAGVTEKCADDLGAALNILNITTTNAGWATTSADANFANGESASVYFYQLAPSANNKETPETFNLKIQVKPIMGLAESGSADGCEYWMDAVITVTVQFEVLQADYLNAGEDDASTDGVVETTGITFVADEYTDANSNGVYDDGDTLTTDHDNDGEFDTAGDYAAAAWTTALTGVQAGA